MKRKNTLSLKKEDKIRGFLCEYYDNASEYYKYELDNIDYSVSNLCADIYYDLKEKNIKLTGKNVVNRFLDIIYEEVI